MRALALTLLAVAGCSPQPPAELSEPKPVAPAPAVSAVLPVPVGAILQLSGFLTVEQVPPSPAKPYAPPPERELTYYAELAGVSNEEAAKRLKEQDAARSEFERLMRQLRTKERGNFTDAELIHRPDWAYLLFFKRDPEATLARYTSNPRFQARHARYTESELKTLIQPWIERFERERLFTGYGLNARQGRAEIDLVVDEQEFAAIAARNGWGPIPDYLQLTFTDAPVGPAVDPALAERIRIFPQSDRNLGIIHQAAYSGRIVLRDGCFFVVDGLPHRQAQLAYFAREVGLGLDPQGYLALHARVGERRHLGRIGEPFTWAGPLAIGEDAPMVAELRQRCGNAPLMHVGTPESSAIFNARYGLPRENPPPPPPRPQTD